ncbi:MAG: AAA family ATPase [Muribaculaceae bacterium]|nr:AAA family ATPase [Muribaculaceae bacterium]
MEQKQLLQDNSRFGDYEIAIRISTHHEGEREVYRAKSCSTGEIVAITVFNLCSKRYVPESASRKKVPDFIDEVAFLRSCNDLSVGFAKVIDCGSTKVGKNKLGWIVQEFCSGDKLSEIIHKKDVISLTDTLIIISKLNRAVREIMKFTHGGGHYGISIDNVLVEFDKDENVADVKLIGLTNIGARCHGSVPFRNDECDNRFRAPETVNGVFSHLTDIYSLGMVMTMMLCGVSETEPSPIDLDKTDPLKYRNSFIDKSRKHLSAPLRLILEQATDVNLKGRFQTVDKFQYFLNKLAKGKISRQNHVENPTGDTAKSKKHDDEEENWLTRLNREVQQKAHGKNRHGRNCHADEKRKLPGGEAVAGSLDEVAGMDELKVKFRRNFVRILRNPQIAKAYGITPCNCTLLYGPQGCGKTFIAEKAAQESGLKYKIINPSDLGSIYIHGAQKKIAETFRDAEKNAPIILIFDEFDAIAPKRDGELNPNQANEVNELLTRLNNCAEKGVFVLATTNRPELIDSAILRTGRVDETYYVSLPDFKARHDIFCMELDKRPCGGDIDPDALARATENYTCSDLSYIVRESARRCFDETIAAGADSPIPLSQKHLIDVIKHTQSSVSAEELKSYREMRERMEHSNGGDNRTRVGFFTGN